MFERAAIAFLGTLCIGLVPFVPSLLRVRIGVLEWLGLESIAQFHERNFEFLVLLARVMMAIVGMILLGLAVGMGG